MGFMYLAIEKDENVNKRESAFWLSRGITSIRVTSMCEGIKIALTNKFLYIGINSSNIDYRPQLRILREVTNDPIFISTTSYTMQEQAEAFELGADSFGQISDSPNDNYYSVMSAIKRLNERTKQRKSPIRIFTHNDILIAPEYHRAFVKDTEINLTKNEMTILKLLLSNRGVVLTHDLINEATFDTIKNKSLTDNIYSTMKRLRKKLTAVTGVEYIETLINLGYRLY